MDLSVRAAYAQHDPKVRDESDFHRENHVPDNVSNEFEGLDTGRGADDVEDSDSPSSRRDDIRRAYEELEG